MTVEVTGPATRSVKRLFACTRGATMFEYVTVLGVVTLTGAVAFGHLGDNVRLALNEEMSAVAEASGEADGPVGSLAEDVATAGAEALAVQGSWALAQKAGTAGLAAARKKHRGRGSAEFKDSQADRGGSVGGSCRNGVCTSEDGESCFAAGTPVATPTGPTPIERLAPGDLVLSRDDLTGNFSVQRVSATFVTLDHELMDVHTVAMSGEEASLRVTPGHPFWTPTDSWVPASTLLPGDVLADASGAEVSVVRVAAVPHRATVYNLEVEGTHTYFAGATPIWVHNGNCFSADDDESPAGQDAQQGPQNPPAAPPPPAHQEPPVQPQTPAVPPPKTHSKQDVVNYINDTIAGRNEQLQAEYDARVQEVRDKGKTVDEWNAMIDKKIQKVENRQGDYDDYDDDEARVEIERLRNLKIPPRAPQMVPIGSLDAAAAASTKSCKDVPCTSFGGELFEHAGGGAGSRAHVGPIQPNQLVNVDLKFPENSGNNHFFNTYYDDAGNAYVIQTYVGHEVPVVTKMTQQRYQELFDRATSGGPGWKEAYKELFHVDPGDASAPDVAISDPVPAP